MTCHSFPRRTRGRFKILAAATAIALLAAAGASPPAAAFNSCTLDSDRYKTLQGYKQAVTLDEFVDTYMKEFAAAGLDRDAQAVMRRMRYGGEDLETALDTHISRFYADRPAAAKAQMRTAITDAIEGLDTLEELVRRYEGLEITTAYARDWYRQALEAWDPQPPRPPAHYAGVLERTAESVRARGFPEEVAALRGAVAAQAAVDRDMNIAGPAIDRNAECIWSWIGKYENRIRYSTSPLTEADKAWLAEHYPRARIGSRLSLLSGYKVGERPYWQERMRAWRTAAGGER